MRPGAEWRALLAGLPGPAAGRVTIGLAVDTGPHGAELIRAAASLAGTLPGIAYVWHDDLASAEGGVQAARALVASGMRLVIGHFNSGSALAAAPVYAEAGTVLLAPAATHPALTSAMPNCFRLCGHDLTQARLFADRLAASRDAPVLIVQRIPHGLSLGDAIETLLIEARMNYVRLDADRADDLPEIRPGPVAVIGRHAFAAGLLPRLGSHSTVLLSDDCYTDHLLDGVRGGGWGACIAVVGDNRRGSADRPVSAYSHTTRAAIEVLGAAVERAGGDPARVATTLRDNVFSTCLGQIGFDAGGEPIGIGWRWLEIAPACAGAR